LLPRRSIITFKHARKKQSISLFNSAKYLPNHTNPRMGVRQRAFWKVTGYRRGINYQTNLIWNWHVLILILRKKQSRMPRIHRVRARTKSTLVTDRKLKSQHKLTHQETIILAQKALGDADRNLHIDGLKNLLGEINQHNGFTVDIAENISLDKDIDKYTIIYLVGKGSFQLNTEEQAALGVFLQSGGVVFGEGCAEGQAEVGAKAIRDFGLAFNQLAKQLHCKLETVKRGQPVLSSPNLFSAVPQGAGPNGILLEDGHMIYSGSDYGCAWQGGHKDDPLARDIIRSAFEIGINIVTYAYKRKGAQH